MARLSAPAACTALLAATLGAQGTFPGNGTPLTTLASKYPSGTTVGGSFSVPRSLSRSGRFVLIGSKSFGQQQDVSYIATQGHLLDRLTGQIEIVTKSQNGALANADSAGIHLSADNQQVLINGWASNLVPGDTNGVRDYFVKDRVTGTVEMVSVTWQGGLANGSPEFSATMSADARTVGFDSYATNLVPGDTNGVLDVFVRDRLQQTTVRISVGYDGSEANGASASPSVSGGGRYIGFTSAATNIVPNDLNGWGDGFVHDLWTGEAEIVTVASDGTQGNYGGGIEDLSDDGRYVVFDSFSDNLVAGDTNQVTDLFIHDRVTKTTERVNVSATGGQANSNVTSPWSRLSGDGRFAVFASAASNLVPGDWNQARDVFRKDLWTGAIEIANLTHTGSQSLWSSNNPNVSADGRFVSFNSFAEDLTPDQNPNVDDVFVRDFGWATGPDRFCLPTPGSLDCTPSMRFQGQPSASSGQAFHLAAVDVRNGRLALLIYSTTASAYLPFSGAWLCLYPPFGRTPVQDSGGSPPPTKDCSGQLDLDFNGWIAGGLDPALVPGQAVWTQYWVRDPEAPSGGGACASDGVTFVIAL